MIHWQLTFKSLQGLFGWFLPALEVLVTGLIFMLRHISIIFIGVLFIIASSYTLAQDSIPHPVTVQNQKPVAVKHQKPDTVQSQNPVPVRHQTVSRAISDSDHKEVLLKYIKQAEAFREKNLNRFGIYELQRYDAALDSLYKKEFNDTLKSFMTNYLKVNESRNFSLGSLNTQIKQLTIQKEEAGTRFNKLLKKAVIASVIWLLIILVLMRLRSRTLKNAQSRLDNSVSQLQVSKQNFEKGTELLHFATQQQEKVHATTRKDESLQKEVTENLPSFDLSFPKEEMSQIQNKLKTLWSAVALNDKLVSLIFSQQKDFDTEKVSTNLNQLCDQCIEAVYYGTRGWAAEGRVESSPMSQPAASIAIAKDLEKNLPVIKAIPNAVTYLLLNVLDNAFCSVEEKRKQNSKGYAPKVTISTRVLPRFLQIRIKDNGLGMMDEMIAHIHEPFYSGWMVNQSAGLGMFFARKIITEMHKGEIKIESQVGEGTDVYLKFYV